MLIASILALGLAIQAPVSMAASVDRSVAPIGDEVAYTLRATTTSTGPIRVELPQVDGLELLERSERVDPIPRVPGLRELVLEARFRAIAVGTWRIGPVLVFVGGDVVEVAPDVMVTVRGAAGGSGLPNDRVLDLIRRAPAPRAGASVEVITSSDRVVVGEQLDVLTVAWFPRTVRTRLRRAPTLKPPSLSSVWSVPQPAIPGIVASVTREGETYDLFVSHQVVFPLAPGPLRVPPAQVEYAIPASRRSAVAERLAEESSRPLVVVVEALPAEGRPPDFTGPVATGLGIAYRLRELPARAGDPLPVDLLVSGEGNLVFWAPPIVEWPPGTRAYLDGVGDAQRVVDGRLGGVKTFRFLVLPDSAGSVGFPDLSYPYFDPARRAYREATAAGLTIPVLEPRPSGAARSAPSLAPSARDWSRRVADFGPSAARWWLLGVLPPLGLIGLGVGRRLRVRPRGRKAPRATPAQALETFLAAHQPVGSAGDAVEISGELRRAGVDRDLASELARLRDELDRARFGPGAGAGEPALGLAVSRALKRVPRPLRRLHRLGLLALAVIPRADAQVATGDSLYRDRGYVPAARAFRDEARVDPLTWQRWYNLAAAEYMSGADGNAAAALAVSLELAPRAEAPRALWRALEREHEPLRQADRPFPLSAGERWAVVVGLVWLAALALAIGARPAWLQRVPALLAASAVGFAVLLGRAERQPAGFTQSQLAIKVSPHGLAPERGTLPRLYRVAIELRKGEWLLVRDRLGNRGWVPRASIAPIRGVD
jgi:hypothetical protein